MSDPLRAAWEEEIAEGDWPFDGWNLPALALRQPIDFLSYAQIPTSIRPIFFRLARTFDKLTSAPDRARLEIVLGEIVEMIDGAVEISRNDAYAMWSRHEIWFSALDESLLAGDEPALLAIECLDFIGPLYATSPQELCAALGLWCLAEHCYFATCGAVDRAALMLSQTAVALAEAEWYRGVSDAINRGVQALAERKRAAAIKGHASNRKNKERGREIWLSRVWAPQAAAEREISASCNITVQVAARWVREFKHATGPTSCNAE